MTQIATTEKNQEASPNSRLTLALRKLKSAEDTEIVNFMRILLSIMVSSNNWRQKT